MIRYLLTLLFLLCTVIVYAEDSTWGVKYACSDSINATERISNFTQDGTGRLWAVISDSLCTWNDGWNRVSVNIPSSSSNSVSSDELSFVRTIETGPDGTIYVPGNWQEDSPHYYLQFYGDQVRKVEWIESANTLSTLVFFVDGAGQGWMCYNGLEGFFRQENHTLKPLAEIDISKLTYDIFHRDNRLFHKVYHDAFGRFWITPRLDERGDYPFIVIDPEYTEGRVPIIMDETWKNRFKVIIYDRSKQRYPEEAYAPQLGRYTGMNMYYEMLSNLGGTFLVNSCDDKSMWVGLPDSLWKMDLQTYNAACENEKYASMIPESSSVKQLMNNMNNNDMNNMNYMADEKSIIPIPLNPLWTDGVDQYLELDSSGKIGGLLRLRDGKWTFLTDKISYKLLSTKRGIWFSGRESALIFMPRDGGAFIDIGWEKEFKEGAVNSLVQLPDGKLLANGYYVFSETEYLEKIPLKIPQFKKLDIVYLIQDNQGYIYAIQSKTAKEPSRWDGEQWENIRIDNKAYVQKQKESGNDSETTSIMYGEDQRHPTIGLDTRQQLWFFENELDSTYPCSVYTITTKTWKYFDDYLIALMAQPDHTIKFSQHYSALDNLEPVHGPDGKLGFVNGKYVHYYDGKKWKRWSVESITGNRVGYFKNSEFIEGHFTIYNYDKIYQLDDTDTWKAKGECLQKDPNRSQDEKLPVYCGNISVKNFAKDRYGMYWFLDNHRLYHAGYGKCLEYFAADEASPFIRDSIDGVAYIDRKGNIFLDHDPIMILPPKGPLPVLHMLNHTIEGNHVVINVETAPDTRYVWRLSSGDWQEPQSGPTLTLGPLPDGEHTIELFALTNDLQVSPLIENISVHVAK